MTYLTLDGPAPIPVQIASDLGFVVACAMGCAFLIAASLRFGLKRSGALASLSANAYSLYLVHYVFVVWMQYALLALSVSAVLKAPIVFIVAVVVSWIIILAVQRIPLGARLIGVRPTPVAA
jgi:surface polysaccharide O-acyltransferase-like enzyme